MIEGLKPFYTTLLRPLIGFFKFCHIHPNHLTVAGVFIFAAAGYFTAQGNWYIAAALVTFGAFADGWDGLLARETNQTSLFGGILDSTMDRITEILWLLGLTVFYVQHPEYGLWGIYLAFTGICGSLMVSYVKARAEVEKIPCKGGIAQRPERIILVGLGLLAGPRFTVYGIQAMVWALAILTFFTWLTVFQRLGIAAKGESGVKNEQ